MEVKQISNQSNSTPPAKGPDWAPAVLKPGPQTKALSRFYRNGTWTGTVKENGMGPGSPEMVGKGRAACEWIINGLWLSCTFTQDQLVGDKKVLTWEAKWILGWDAIAREYKAVGVDSNGVSFQFKGQIEGDKLIMESTGESPAKLRFTTDASDPNAIKWKNEISIDNGPWKLIEEYIIIPQS